MTAQVSAQSLQPPTAPTRSMNQRFMRPQDDIDDFLSSDFETSFASNVSLNSPPRNSAATMPDYEYHEPMDISPCPPSKPQIFAPAIKGSRPRAFTTSSRLFGRDVSNESIPSVGNNVLDFTKSGFTQFNGKGIQRTITPMEWMLPNLSTQTQTIESQFTAPMISPISEDSNAMDVDMSDFEPAFPVRSSSVEPIPASPTVTFNNLFYDDMSPRRSFESPARSYSRNVRRSLSPESVRAVGFEQDLSSSPGEPLMSSPSDRRLTRKPSVPLLSRFEAKPSLQSLGQPSVNGLKRPRMPVFSTRPYPSETVSAFPIMDSEEAKDIPSPMALHAKPAARRAFSAMLPPSGFEPSSPDTSFEGPDASSPAQAYAKRQQAKTLRRRDGTEDFRPLTGIAPKMQKEISDSPSSRFLKAGMPGFGDNESHGKLLPCHRVSEDGLMRIVPNTLNDLLDGKYDNKIGDYHIIDCRFDYEYNGGHIRSAVNVRSTEGLEALLLGQGAKKPTPSVSGDSTAKTILVFHCEFSAKRAPTFAKHLRSKDRLNNNHIYPKIHYPEVYVLEGGYSRYFKSSQDRCEPRAYVAMDDPSHADTCKTKMDQFRKTKFGRHKSYAYGEAGLSAAGRQSNMLSQQQPMQHQQLERKDHKSSLFAPSNVARARRGGANGLGTVDENKGSKKTSAKMLSPQSDDEDTDIGDSPCPPANKNQPLKMKKISLSRGPLARAETYGPARTAH